ncbi:MAG: DUF948 domain-containing protein [Melioribacteraceae bacterium]|nr:DUF948 domain-containing protein [Melioribacteraceae bacterium]
MTLIDILLAVLLIAGSALCIYLIISLNKLSESVDSIKKDIHDLTDETIPVIKNLNQITEQALEVSSTAKKQVSDLNDTIEEVKSKIVSFKDRFKSETADNQIIIFINNLKAIIKGFSAFVKDISK